MLAHVYWHGMMPVPLETAMRTATLAGTILGQFAFGVLADLYGRRKMYGLELLVIIVATVGVAMAADGASNSMSLVGWLISWRFLMGLGIGGDYPLSAVITSEFAPTRSRARMLATVFYMQPCGYLTATLVSVIALVGNKSRIPTAIPKDLGSVKSCTDDEMCRRAVDSVWRWVIGIGAVPAAVAIFFRFTIPESPRYTMEVLNRPDEALEDVNEMARQGPADTYRNPRDIEMQRPRPQSLLVRDTRATGLTAIESTQPPLAEASSIATNPNEDAMRDSVSLSEAIRPSSSIGSRVTGEHAPDATGVDDIAEDDGTSRWKRYRTGFSEHFLSQGHWPTLLGTSLAWASVDFGKFYSPNSDKRCLNFVDM
jgi:PHS family inorganic phosphate transporter-like MFS transporter